MQILSNTGGVAMTNAFVVADEKSGQAVLFDAPDHTTEPLLKTVADEGWTLAGLWLTHGHFDHFADHAIVRRHFPNVQILIHPLDEPKAADPARQLRLFGLSFQIPPLQADGKVEGGQQLTIGALKVVVIHTPGHSPGHVAYHFPQEQVLIGGDLIIGGSVGRTDLPDSDHRELEKSVRTVMQLPDATRLLGGHGPESTLGEERRNNPIVGGILRTR
jgi:hydroxyacylglutathione hydrolase